MEVKRKVFNRYIGKDVPSEAKIYAAYLNEGMEPSEASKKAKIIHREMNTLSKQEERLWKKVRRNEYCSGLNPLYEGM